MKRKVSIEKTPHVAHRSAVRSFYAVSRDDVIAALLFVLVSSAATIAQPLLVLGLLRWCEGAIAARPRRIQIKFSSIVRTF